MLGELCVCVRDVSTLVSFANRQHMLELTLGLSGLSGLCLCCRGQEEAHVLYIFLAAAAVSRDASCVPVLPDHLLHLSTPHIYTQFVPMQPCPDALLHWEVARIYAGGVCWCCGG